MSEPFEKSRFYAVLKKRCQSKVDKAISSDANSRVSEALKPRPAPTISAISLLVMEIPFLLPIQVVTRCRCDV